MITEADYCIIIVDDEEMVTRSISTYLTLATDFRVMAFNDPREALTYATGSRVDLVISDFLMPSMNGLEFLTEIRRMNSEATLILLTGYADKENAIKAINELQLFQYIEKPWDNDELAMIIRNGVEKRDLIGRLSAKVMELEESNTLIEAQKNELAKLYELLRRDFDYEMERVEDVIVALARAIEAKDAYTENHTDRVARLAVTLGEHMGVDDKAKRVLYIGGLIHDIGKIGVSEAILNKPSALDTYEFKEIQRHPVIGEEICRPLNTLSNILTVIRHHHEKLDGSGYPDGLMGDEISEAARIVAVVDIYDALTSDRPYRTRMTDAEAYGILKAEAKAGKLSESVVDSLIAVLTDSGTHTA